MIVSKEFNVESESYLSLVHKELANSSKKDVVIVKLLSRRTIAVDWDLKAHSK